MLKKVHLLILGFLFVATAIQWWIYFESNAEEIGRNGSIHVLRWLLVCLGTGVLLWFSSLEKSKKGKLYFFCLAIGYPIVSTVNLWTSIIFSNVPIALVESIAYSLFLGVLLCLQLLQVKPDQGVDET
jgi:hypothetical protein